MKKVSYTIASAILVSSVFATAQAESTKSAFSLEEGISLSVSTNDEGVGVSNSVVIGDAYIRVPGSNKLIVDLAIQCGLHTVTQVKSKGSRDTSIASASVSVSLSVIGDDLVPAKVTPSSVIYCGREQTLSATLGGIITNLAACTGSGDNVDCLLSDEEISLGLKTMNANAYNFVVELPSSQNYTVTATAVLDTCTSSTTVTDTASEFFGDCMNGEDPDATAAAFINGAAMDVQEVRF